MARRAPATLADYLVVAISPALIMLLIGSFLWFAVEVFYQGDYPQRLTFILAMFVLGIVGIARISMEQGASRAALFGVPLAAVVGLAVMRFVEFRGPLAALGPLPSWLLMAVVWWAAHQLTWDCTLIDDSQDASGQGLLEQLGLDPAADGVSSAGDSAAAGAASSAVAPWWQRWLEPDRRPHAPGVWVVYCSLAALPLFGVGGWFVPASDPEARARTFWLLVVFVASALLLLLTTSFLGLRKYLRQRRLEMPLEMTATWMGAGAALILAMLLAATILPRPRAEHSLSQLPLVVGSAVRQASEYAWGREGTDDPSQAGSAEGQASSATQQGGSEGAAQGSGAAEAKSGASSQPSSSASSGQTEQTGGQQAGGQQAGGTSPGGREKGSGEQPTAARQPSADAGASSSGSEQRSANEERAQDERAQGQRPLEETREGQKAKPPAQSQAASEEAADQTTVADQAPDAPPPSAGPLLRRAGSALATLLRWLLYLVLLIAGAVAAWKYRGELAAAWRQLVEELREWWARWTNRPETAPPEPAAPLAAAPRPFSSFADPFATGAAAAMPWPELVRYTFLAVEAWGREHNCPRATGWTPHEFARAVASAEPRLARDLERLAAWYGQIAYAPQAARPQSAEALRGLWHELGQERSRG